MRTARRLAAQVPRALQIRTASATATVSTTLPLTGPNDASAHRQRVLSALAALRSGESGAATAAGGARPLKPATATATAAEPKDKEDHDEQRSPMEILHNHASRTALLIEVTMYCETPAGPSTPPVWRADVTVGKLRARGTPQASKRKAKQDAAAAWLAAHAAPTNATPAAAGTPPFVTEKLASPAEGGSEAVAAPGAAPQDAVAQSDVVKDTDAAKGAASEARSGTPSPTPEVSKPNDTTPVASETTETATGVVVDGKAKAASPDKTSHTGPNGTAREPAVTAAEAGASVAATALEGTKAVGKAPEADKCAGAVGATPGADAGKSTTGAKEDAMEVKVTEEKVAAETVTSSADKEMQAAGRTTDSKAEASEKTSVTEPKGEECTEKQAAGKGADRPDAKGEEGVENGSCDGGSGSDSSLDGDMVVSGGGMAEAALKRALLNTKHRLERGNKTARSDSADSTSPSADTTTASTPATPGAGPTPTQLHDLLQKPAKPIRRDSASKEESKKMLGVRNDTAATANTLDFIRGLITDMLQQSLRTELAVHSHVLLDTESRAALRSAVDEFIPKGWEVSCKHVTLNHTRHLSPRRARQSRLAAVTRFPWRREWTVRVTHIGWHEECVALKIEGVPRNDDNAPHITVAFAKHGMAVNANYITKWIPACEDLRGLELKGHTHHQLYITRRSLSPEDKDAGTGRRINAAVVRRVKAVRKPARSASRGLRLGKRWVDAQLVL